MTQTNFNNIKKLICVQYPGVVNNVDKAIDTLGGIKSISQVYSTTNRRLELRFRPKDAFCKPACSNQVDTFGLLLKVRVKKKKKANSADESEVLGTDIIGIVDTTYKFETFSDFQYLPLAPKDEESPETSGLKCVHDDAMPLGFPDINWFNEPSPYILTPAVFSRVETPHPYNYRSNIVFREDLKQVLGKPRKKRLGHAVVVNHCHVGPIPSAPNDAGMAALTAPDEAVQIIRKLFEEQPLWSKNAILITSKLPFPQIKNILPCVGYYYLSGPWRALWARFGYDPRKDPQSRIYQTMDFRMRNIGGLKGFVKSKINILERATHLKIQQKPKKQHCDYFGQTAETSKQIETDNIYIYTPDHLPPRRQIFYQYCNLKVPEIEEMLARLGEVLPGSLCHERRGWLPAGFDDQCRDILNNYVSDKMRQMIAEESSGQCSDTFFGVVGKNFVLTIRTVWVEVPASTSGETDFTEDLMDQEIEEAEDQNDDDGNDDIADEVFSEDEEDEFME